MDRKHACDHPVAIKPGEQWTCPICGEVWSYDPPITPDELVAIHTVMVSEGVLELTGKKRDGRPEYRMTTDGAQLYDRFRAAVEERTATVSDELRAEGLCGFDGTCRRQIDAAGDCPEHGQPAWSSDRAEQQLEAILGAYRYAYEGRTT